MEKSYAAGAGSGLLGGILYGAIAAIWGDITMVSGLIGSNSLAVAWALVLFGGILLGLCFTWWFGSFSTSFSSGLGYGLIHGAIWWILGSIVVMPLVLGISFYDMFRGSNLAYLFANLVYGAVVGLAYVGMTISTTEHYPGSQASHP